MQVVSPLSQTYEAESTLRLPTNQSAMSAKNAKNIFMPEKTHAALFWVESVLNVMTLMTKRTSQTATRTASKIMISVKAANAQKFHSVVRHRMSRARMLPASKTITRAARLWSATCAAERPSTMMAMKIMRARSASSAKLAGFLESV